MSTPKSSQDIADELRAMIATGKLSPGQRLIELQLSQQLEVTRNRVRDALRRLEHEGFVKITPNIGAVVAEFSRADIEQMYDLLAVLDGLAVRIATPFITPRQITTLESIATTMETSDKPIVFADHNNEFHSLLCSFSENGRLMRVAENLRLNISAFGFRSFYVPGQIMASNEDHRKILQAIRDRKPAKAETVIRKHVVDAKNRLIKWMYKSL